MAVRNLVAQVFFALVLASSATRALRAKESRTVSHEHQEVRHKTSLHGHMPDEDDAEDGGDEYEYGGKETEVTQSNAGDFSVHQFLVNDDGRDGPSSSSDNAQEEMARQKAAQADDHFNSEDTPDPDAFVQLAAGSTRKAGHRSHRQAPGDEDDEGQDEFEYGDRETEVTQSNSADFSVHQFLVKDDARDGSSDGDGDARIEMAKQKAAVADDHFNSEDTPDPDAFVQLRKAKRAAKAAKASQEPWDEEADSDDDYEYGSKETEVTQSNAGDFSVHQFLVNDDARDGPAAADDNAATEMARQSAAAADDHFNSEDTPDPNAFAQIHERKVHSRGMGGVTTH